MYIKQCQKCNVLKVCGMDKIFYNLFGYRSFDQLIPDAPELILNYLEGEQDASCKRNAFMMLTHVDRVSMSIYGMCVCVCACWYGSTCCDVDSLFISRNGLWTTCPLALIKYTLSMISSNWS